MVQIYIPGTYSLDLFNFLLQLCKSKYHLTCLTNIPPCVRGSFHASKDSPSQVSFRQSEHAGITYLHGSIWLTKENLSSKQPEQGREYLNTQYTSHFYKTCSRAISPPFQLVLSKAIDAQYETPISFHYTGWFRKIPIIALTNNQWQRVYIYMCTSNYYCIISYIVNPDYIVQIYVQLKTNRSFFAQLMVSKTLKHLNGNGPKCSASETLNGSRDWGKNTGWFQPI